jgi:hypothetical protein
MEDETTGNRSVSPSKKRIQDPHASLALFAEQQDNGEAGKSQPAVIPPRTSAKPAEREYSELFATGHEDHEPSTENASSPKKNYGHPVIAPKGASKFQPSRLFDENDAEELPARYKSNPAKYNHFDLGEAAEKDHFQHVNPAAKANAPLRAKTNKHLSQWDFEDFVTPEKVRHRVRGQDVRHFGWSDDEGEKVESPGKQQKVNQPRRDNEAHFEFKDDGTPGPGQHRLAGKPKGSGQNTGLGLYKNNVYDEDANNSKSTAEKEPLSTVTNNVSRTKDFDKHWLMSDSSPATEGTTNNENRPLAGDRKKAVQMMDASWESHDHSPEQNKKAVVNKPVRRGMESHWNFGDE